ncbi:MAG: carboxynorspermidine decarboxylase [Clostridia bacterium]|jgi:carboxynorspermidine decarboxylase|nr:carboxynorspermidine decarboxylase [Clostridia bacterium]
MGWHREIKSLPTPCYLLDETLLEKNLQVLDTVQQRTGCKILLALKGFSMFAAFPQVARYLKGITASSLFEARLGYEEMGKEVHIYAPAYLEAEFAEVMRYCDHIVFNSLAQWNKYKDRVKNYPGKKIECGLRLNPGYSEIQTPLYDPCFQHSRLGVTLENFQPEQSSGLDGFHFHTMCEQNSDTLERTVQVIEEKFGPYIKGKKWLNLGGGHHITRQDYDVDRLIRIILSLQEKYGVEIYLEPGEAIALNTGYLISEVLDIVENEMPIAVLDASAACHMPDVLEMPYRPEIFGAKRPEEYPYTYRLAGNTCLAGDVIGDYSFAEPLKIGDRLVFGDMAHYTMVKNNTFNGVNLPAIVLYNPQDGVRVIRQFSYEDYKGRLS